MWSSVSGLAFLGSDLPCGAESWRLGLRFGRILQVFFLAPSPSNSKKPLCSSVKWPLGSRFGVAFFQKKKKGIFLFLFLFVKWNLGLFRLWVKTVIFFSWFILHFKFQKKKRLQKKNLGHCPNSYKVDKRHGQNISGSGVWPLKTWLLSLDSWPLVPKDFVQGQRKNTCQLPVAIFSVYPPHTV